jgi:predicted dehydrogenase
VISSKRIGMGLVGAGFVGPHHIDAVRRLGFVDVVALAGSSDETARAKAQSLGVPKSYGRYEALLEDPQVQVVHTATPNHLHYPVIAAAIAKGKHVVSDKPLAMTAAESKALRDQARRAGIVHAITFNYRGNPLVQEARRRIADGEIGPPYFLHGSYLQDWLIKETDYSWRLEPDRGGASAALGDIGSHWCDLAEHVSGLRITQVLGAVTTVVRRRRKPAVSSQAFAEAGGSPSSELVDVNVEDLASVLLRFDNGATGSFSVGQVCAGHKNDLVLEVCGGSGTIRWRQEHQNELWIGHRDQANQILLKDPSLVGGDVSRYARLPGGHQEGWADAFFNVMRDIYEFIVAGKGPDAAHPPAFATFDDGYRAALIVESILASARAGGAWTTV